MVAVIILGVQEDGSVFSAALQHGPLCGWPPQTPLRTACPLTVQYPKKRWRSEKFRAYDLGMKLVSDPVSG